MKQLLSLLTILILAAACTRSSDQKPKESAAQAVSPVVAGQVIVKFNDSADAKAQNRVLGQFAKHEFVSKARSIYVVTDKMLNGNEKAMADRLASDSAVEFAQPNFKISLSQAAQSLELTQDPYFLRLWGLRNFGQDAPNGIEGKEGADIGVTQAWANNHKGSKDIRVAVLDTGCWYTHPDLAANIWINLPEKDGIQGVDDDKNGYVDDIHGWDAISDNRARLDFEQVGDPDPVDDHGHGTHVSGTIGAVGGNAIGIVGINWNVSIACVKFLDKNGSGSSVDEGRALEYIIANDFDVVNGSYGGGEKSPLKELLLKEAGKKGILFVFAAGNESTDIDNQETYPASYKVDNTIVVAATDSRDQIADFSNYGQKSVHIAAPGVAIMSTVPPFVAGKDMPPYAVWSGTSMATPHVVGAVALLLAAEPSLRKQPAKIRERLMATADFKPQLASMVASGGRLNIGKAIANDTSGNPLAGGTWEEVPFEVNTPRYPQKKVDNAWTIHVPGAKAIQVHIRTYQVESGFDQAVLYDGTYRSSMYLVGEGADVWSPTMLGDTAYLKFSNSLVSIEGKDPHGNFNSAGVQIDKVKVLK